MFSSDKRPVRVTKGLQAAAVHQQHSIVALRAAQRGGRPSLCPLCIAAQGSARGGQQQARPKKRWTNPDVSPQTGSPLERDERPAGDTIAGSSAGAMVFAAWALVHQLASSQLVGLNRCFVWCQTKQAGLQ